MAAFGGVLLLIGLWTPVLATVIALLEFWIAISVGEVQAAHILTAVIAFALSVLGPGAWSVDARLFGRRRISISDR
jgi:putative oxidoreductase